LPFLVTQDPTKWQGGRIQGKNGEQKITLAMILRLYKPFVIPRVAYANFLQGGAKTNELKCFISLF
jgi:hypothetical protein